MTVNRTLLSSKDPSDDLLPPLRQDMKAGIVSNGGTLQPDASQENPHSFDLVYRQGRIRGTLHAEIAPSETPGEFALHLKCEEEIRRDSAEHPTH